MYKFAAFSVFMISIPIFVCSCGEEESVVTAEQSYQLCVVDTIADNSDEMLLIGYPADVCFGPSDEVLVLDQTAVCVYTFSADGNVTGQFGRSGNGPGEMGNPMSIETIDHLILIRDATKHGYLLFDSTYSLVEEVSHWPSGSPTDMQNCGDSSFVALCTSIESGDQEMLLRRTVSRFPLGAAEPTCTYYSDVSAIDLSNPSDFVRMGTESIAFTADYTGRVYLSEITGEEYLVTVYSPVGDILYSITRDCDPVEKTRSELDEEISYMEAEMRTMGVEGVGNWVPDPLKPMITGLGIDGNMNLWVQRGTEVDQTIDVFDTSSPGVLICTVVLPIQGIDWNIRVSPVGSIAWQTNPDDGKFTFYTLELNQLDN